MPLHAPQPTHKHIVWRSRDDLGGDVPDGTLRDLLTVSGSMTGALRALCRDKFRLSVLAETSTALAAYQCGELAEQRGLVREVLMGCGDTPWLFAQTLIPVATLTACRWLGELGDRPLGDALFSRSDVERSDFVFAILGPSTPLLQRIRHVLPGETPAGLWARRSYFYVDGRALLVNEVFLPGLPVG